MKAFTKLLSLAAMLICIPSLLGATNVDAEELPLLSRYIQTLYSSENGMLTDEANAIVQTRDGYIWLGGYTGLIRFNGTSFETIADIDTNGFESSSVRALLEDRNGTLWVGTNDRGLFTYKNGEIAAVDTGGVISNSVRTLALDNDGNVIAGSTKGCCRITEGKAQALCADIASVQISSMQVTPGGSIWLVSEAGDIYQIFGTSLVFSAKSADFSDFTCISISAHDDSVVLLGTDGEAMISLDTSDSDYEATLIPTDGVSGVTKIARDKAGTIWLCGDSGIAVLKNGKAQPLDGALMTLMCADFCEDYEGNLWFTSTRQGVLKLVPSKFTDTGLDGTVVNAVCIRDGLLYTATDTGLIIRDTKNGYATIENDLTKLLDGIRLRSVMLDKSNRVWICAYEKYGAVCYDGKGWSIFNGDAGLTGDKARCSFQMADGRVAIGTTDGLCIISEGKVTEKYTTEQGLENAVILSISQDKAGRLWIGTDGSGIYRLENGSLTNISSKNGLSSDIILRMRYDEARDAMWISTGTRLCFMKSDGSVSVLTALGNGSRSIFDVLFADNGKLWVLTATDIIIADADALLAGNQTGMRRLSKSEGLSSTITANSWCCIDSGLLYICCTNGMYTIDMNGIPVNTAPPRLAINAVYVDGERQKLNDMILLSRDNSRIVIEYSLLTFTGQGGSISYCLDGYDDDAIKTDEIASEISYTNLGGGGYTLRITGTNSDNISCAADITLKLYKEYIWYEIPYVWLAIVIIVIVLVLIVFNKYLAYQTKTMMANHAALRGVTEQAMTAIANTIDAKDTYTNGHSRRVAQYSLEIARRMGLPESELDEIYYSGLLHDIGKIGVPDNILTKPTRLTDNEFKIIKRHTDKGGDILKSITTMPQISEGARYHHEKYDGTGYTHGLKGDEIPLIGRIICAADTFDAMYSDRPYRKAKTRIEIAAEFVRCSGTQFEPHIADIVINMINDGFEAK